MAEATPAASMASKSPGTTWDSGTRRYRRRDIAVYSWRHATSGARACRPCLDLHVHRLPKLESVRPGKSAAPGRIRRLGRTILAGFRCRSRIFGGTNMTKRFLAGAVLGVALLAASSLQAHHSLAGVYDLKKVER